MKRSSDWDEKSIENQLRQLPKIEDKQSKEALFERIQERLQEDQIKERSKKKNWFVPTIAAAAVLFLMLLIIPSFLNERNVTIEDPNAEFMMERIAEDATSDEAGMMNTEMAPGIKSVNDLYPNYISAVQPFEKEYYHEQLVEISVPVNGPTGEFVISVTVMADGANEIERFLTAKDNFSGEAWGIGQFPNIPINEAFEGKAGVLVIDIPSGSLESLSTAENFVYNLALKETFWPQFREIEFSSDGEPGVFWGQTGQVTTINLDEPNRGYYLYESYTGHLFLVRGKAINAPGNNQTESVSFEETLLLMKQGDTNIGYNASIPEEIVITDVSGEKDVATITFANGTFLEDTPLNLAMLEAILFAARDFGFLFVQFEGVEPTHVGSYFLGDLIEIPRYINFIR